MTTSSQPVPPVVCTLGARELDERRLEWADLTSLALSSELIEGGTASTYPLALADAIVDLASREVSCCGSWLDSKVAVGDESVRLELTTTNPDGLAVIRRMSGADHADD